MTASSDSKATPTPAEFQTLDPREFEQLVAEVWRADGWDVEVLPPGRDAGIDAIATREDPFPEKQVIQAKRYRESNPVSAPDVQQYASLKQQVPRADSVVIVTSGRFTDSAVARARELNVKLVDGDDLADLVSRVGPATDVEPERTETVEVVESDVSAGHASTVLSLLVMLVLLPVEILLLFSVDEWIDIIRVVLILLVGGYVAWKFAEVLFLGIGL